MWPLKVRVSANFAGLAHHQFGDEYRDVLASVMDGKGVADEVRNDRRPARTRS